MVDKMAAQMTAREAIDDWGWEVEYFFQCVIGPGHDSGWQKSRVYVDTFLKPDVQYGYRVKARDALGNETKWSKVRYAGQRDRTPPAPAPVIGSITLDPNNPRWLVVPVAEPASDASGVQYFFDVDDVNTPGGHDSGWIDTSTYTDPNLAANTQYCYRVKARDLSASLNETGWSPWRCGTTGSGPDIIAPTPNPAQWDPNGLPREYDGFGGVNDFWVEMAAVAATDETAGTVQYYFECDEVPGLSSGWTDQTIYRVKVGPQNRGYRWRVKVRDVAGNVTQPSPWERQQQRPGQAALGTGFTRILPQ
jgi:hypothetical protein